MLSTNWINKTMLNSGKRYKDDLEIIFDQWPKLYLGFDVEPEIWILKIYAVHTNMVYKVTQDILKEIYSNSLYVE